MPRLAYLLAAFAVFCLPGAPAARADGEIVMKIATVAPADSPWAELLKKYKKDVEKATGDKVKVKLMLGGTFGDENESLQKCKDGQVEAVGASTGAIASQVPEVNVLEIPFLFRDAGEADHVIDTLLTGELEKVFPSYGLRLGFWSENGFRHFASKKKAIKAPADMKGLIMRSQESPVHLAMYKAFGASANPIATTEVLTALQNNTVDGFDQSLLYMIAASWHKSVKHVTLSSHIYQPAAIVFNKEWFDKLPEDIQKTIVDKGRAIQVKGRKGVRDLNPDLVQILKDEGVTVYELSAKEREVFEKAADAARRDFRKTQGKKAVELLDAVEAELKKLRKK